MVDRISELPDELLCHILSLLPLKLAFTTTLLSKQLTPLCYSLPVLRFDCGSENTYNKTEQDCNDTFYHFCRFVDTLMLSPLSTNKPLKMFILVCCLGNREEYGNIFNAWFEAAKQRHVQEFHITLSYHTLNPVIFTSRTLVVLKLLKLKIGNDTSCVDLPSLKTLHLRYVYFQNQNDYIDFLSACPNLEDLHAEPIFYKKRGGNNTSGGLKSLTLSKLVRASIGSKLVRAIIEAIDSLFNVIPVFSNLIHIDLLFSHHSLHGWYGVVELLRHSPKLQILSIRKNTSPSKEWKCPTSVIECVSSHLRSCTILNFQGSANDLRFTNYILQNASLLQEMKLGVTNGMLWERGQFIEELFSCPRNTPGCKLLFEFKCYYD